MSVKLKGKGIIRLGDSTTHGGTVITAHAPTDLGIKIACVGDMTVCPQCKGTFPIVEGASEYTIHGDKVAFDGHKTACGASLISSV